VREAFAVGYIMNWVGDGKKWRGTIRAVPLPWGGLIQAGRRYTG